MEKLEITEMSRDQLLIYASQLEQRVMDLETQIIVLKSGNTTGSGVYLDGVPETYKRQLEVELKATLGGK